MVKLKNFYKITKKVKKHNPAYRWHKIEIPFRMAIIGSCGSGKTNTFFNILNSMNNTFEHLIICCKDKNEPLYEMLEEKLPPCVLRFYEGGEIPDINSLGDIGQSLIVFDDLVVMKNQDEIKEYFIRGRKVGGGLSMVYISQSYYQIPKIIRSQCNYIVLKKIQSCKDLNLILQDFTLGIEKEKLAKMYEEATSGDFLDFFMIDLQNEDYKFRKNFTPLI